MSEINALIAASHKAPTKTEHRTQYPAIDPTRPANSAAGKTVVVSGGAGGIGYLIARGFAKAGAANVALLARRQAPLDESDARLRAEINELKLKTNVWTYLVDIKDIEKVHSIFQDIRQRLSAEGQDKDVDILVTSAAVVTQGESALKFDPRIVHDAFETNVSGNLNLVREFLRPETPAIPEQSIAAKAKDTADAPILTHEKIILDVSSGGTHMKLPGHSLYGPSKLAFTHMMHHLQKEVDQIPGAPIRIHSFSPGVIYSPPAAQSGMTKDSVDWDDDSLPEGFAVWLASPAAKFLKGKFVWSSWDVDELIAIKKKFEEDPLFGQFTLKL